MNRKLLCRFIKIFTLTTFAFIGMFLISKTTTFAGELNFHAVYVGRGDALILESNNHYMIVDSGTSDASTTLVNYLNSLNIPDKKIDYVVSTHPDGDHVGSFPAIFRYYDIGQVIYSPCTKASSYYYDFIDCVKQKGCPYRTPVEGETWSLGDATVKVIYNGSQGSTYNECSIVLKVTCDNKSILLTGDLPSTMERTLMQQGYDFKADILKVGHHGAAASSCADFLDAVNPQYAVISSTKDSTTSLPKPSVLKRLARRFVKTYRTTDGNVLINIKNGVITTKNKENNGYTSIKNGKITLSNNVYYATGEKLTPSVTLTVNGQTISSGNYTVTYSSNRNTGTAKVKLTATGTKYVGTCRTTFIIRPKQETVTGTLSKSNNKVKLTWASQTSATGFQIKYATNKSMTENVKIVTCNSSAKVSKTISGLNYNTKYYFRVRAYKSNIGNGKWSKRICVKTGANPAPAKEKITDCTQISKTSIKLTWKKQTSKKKAGYILEYSTSKKFKAGETNTITYKKTAKNYRTLRNLKKNTAYYIRVRGYNKYGNGKWSKVVKIKTK